MDSLDLIKKKRKVVSAWIILDWSTLITSLPSIELRELKKNGVERVLLTLFQVFIQYSGRHHLLIFRLV